MANVPHGFSLWDGCCGYHDHHKVTGLRPFDLWLLELLGSTGKWKKNRQGWDFFLILFFSMILLLSWKYQPCGASGWYPVQEEYKLGALSNLWVVSMSDSSEWLMGYFLSWSVRLFFSFVCLCCFFFLTFQGLKYRAFKIKGFFFFSFFFLIWRMQIQHAFDMHKS